MSKLTFKEYLMELMVSDDPVTALQDVKQAARNPDRFQKQQLAQTVDQQKEIQKSDDPVKSDKLRAEKLKQQLALQQKRIKQKEEKLQKAAGLPQQGVA